jgi:hypothetical protein
VLWHTGWRLPFFDSGFAALLGLAQQDAQFAGSDDLVLRQEAHKGDLYAVTLLPLDATVRAPPLLAGEVVGSIDMGGKEELNRTHGRVIGRIDKKSEASWQFGSSILVLHRRSVKIAVGVSVSRSHD